jgi:NADPH2:quinone reductase
VYAAVVHSLGDIPSFEEFTGPPSNTPSGRLVVASLNPLDIALVAGELGPLETPCVAGYEGVVALGGERFYVAGPPHPYGSLAELVPVDRDAAFPVPGGVDPALAAALGVAGCVAWTALEYRANLRVGESVLVLGAGGAAGQVALQAARVMGAGTVVGAARGQAAGQARRRGPDAVVEADDGPGLTSELRSASPGGYDVIVDFLWGDMAQPALEAAKPEARYVQVGNSAGAAATINALTLRAKQVTLIGHALSLTPPEVHRQAYAQLLQYALAGSVRLDVEPTPLSDIAHTWKRLKDGAPRKLIVSP